MQTNFLTEAQAAEKCNVAEGTMRNWRTKRKGPPYTKVESAIRYPEDKLDQWLERRTIAHGEVA